MWQHYIEINVGLKMLLYIFTNPFETNHDKQISYEVILCMGSRCSNKRVEANFHFIWFTQLLASEKLWPDNSKWPIIYKIRFKWAVLWYGACICQLKTKFLAIQRQLHNNSQKPWLTHMGWVHISVTGRSTFSDPSHSHK